MNTREWHQLSTADYVAEGADPASPEWSDNGVPLCREECRYHDGKRCALMGFRPGRVCEPTVIGMATLLAKGAAS